MSLVETNPFATYPNLPIATSLPRSHLKSSFPDKYVIVIV